MPAKWCSAWGETIGDCSTYKGRVGAVSEEGGTPAFFTIDAASGDSQGAIWMGGAAPAVDADGNVWVGVGNGSVDSASQAYDDSDSVLELSSSLKLLQYFAPSNWAANNEHDLDMSTEPALLADGQVVEAGKSRIVYLLNGSDLGGIGAEQASVSSGCSEDIDGGTAVVGMIVYLPCLSGVIAVQAGQSPPSLKILWRRKGRRRPANSRWRPGLEYWTKWHALRARSEHGPDTPAGFSRFAGNALSDSGSRRGAPPRPSSRSRCCLRYIVDDDVHPNIHADTSCVNVNSSDASSSTDE